MGLKLQQIAVAALEDIKAHDIAVFDVRKLTSLYDTLVIASADSARQVKALAQHVRDRLKESGAEYLYWIAMLNPFTYATEMLRFAAYSKWAGLPDTARWQSARFRSPSSSPGARRILLERFPPPITICG